MTNRPSRLVLSVPAAWPDGSFRSRFPLGAQQIAGSISETSLGTGALRTGAGATLAGAAIAALTGSGTVTNSAPSANTTSIAMTSTANGTQPWTFGQAFKQGDIPSGQNIAANSGASAFQADVRNVWPDGSVKYAVLSGLSTFVSNAATVQIGPSGSAASGSTVAEPTNLVTTNVVLAPGTGSFPIAAGGTYAINSVLTIDRSTWSRGNGGRVRQILGRVMSEFHYYQPTNDAQVSIWWYVRQYSSGATEIEVAIENGWFGLASETERDYSATININGTAVATYSNLSHYSRTRWSGVYWYAGGAPITPAHNVAYLRATKLVPNYGYTSPTTTAYANIIASAINPTPFALGDYNLNMGDTGDSDSIGVLPQWEAVFCCAADPRAYKGTISNYRGAGRWPVHFRDETTGRVPNHVSYPTATITSGWGTDRPVATVTASVTPGDRPAWDIPHHPSTGYLAYLLEGRWAQLESLQFVGMVSIVDGNPTTRNVLGNGGGVIACVNAPMTTRGAAWSWRSVGQCAAISPSTLNGAAPAAADTAVTNSFRTSIDNTMSWMKQNYIDGTLNTGKFKNVLGYTGIYDGGDDGPTGQFWGRAWMEVFQVCAIAHISDLGIEGITQANLNLVRDHKYDMIMRTCGVDTTWNFRRAALYNMPYTSNNDLSNPQFFTTAQAFAAWLTFRAIPNTTANPGDTLKNHDVDTDMDPSGTSNDADGYWAPIIAALSTAIEHGKPGAAAAFSRVTSAPNYNPVADNINDKPKWGIRSRVAIPTFTWLSGQPLNHYITVTAPPLNQTAILPNPAVAGGFGPGAITDYSGATLRIKGSYFFIHGGGHVDYAGNEIYALSLESNSPTWQRVWGPTPNAQITPNTLTYADGNPAAGHTYGFLEYDDTRDILMRFVGGFYSADGLAAATYGVQFNGTNFAANWIMTFNAQPVAGIITFYPQSCYCRDYQGNVYGPDATVRLTWNHALQNWDSNNPISRSIDSGSNTYVYDVNRKCIWGLLLNFPGQLFKWDLTAQTETLGALTGTDAALMGSDDTQGMAYDPIIDMIFVYRQEGTFHTINPNTGAVTTILPSGTAPAVLSGDGQFAINKKFHYVPNLGGCVLLTKFGDSCFFIRTHGDNGNSAAGNGPGNSSGTGSSGGTGFTANFATTANPIDPTTFLLGAHDGGNWENPKTTGGQAVAANSPTGTGTGDGPTRYSDDIAVIKPAIWTANADQWAQGTVYKAAGYTAAPGSHEVELLLRFSITNGNAHGYEVLWGIQGYIAVVRWNGNVQDYTPIYDPGVGSIAAYADGDILYAQIQGNIITAKKNGVVIPGFPVDVSSIGGQIWTTGQPGFGMWPVDGATVTSAGWKAYTAGNL